MTTGAMVFLMVAVYTAFDVAMILIIKGTIEKLWKEKKERKKKDDQHTERNHERGIYEIFKNDKERV